MSRRSAVIANDRSALWVFSFILLGAALLFLYFWVSKSTEPVAPLLYALLYALLAGLFFAQARRWRHVHRWRRLAASEGVRADVPLARPQPTPNAWALPVLFTITLRPQWFRLLGCTILFGAVVFCLYSLNWSYPYTTWFSVLFPTILYTIILSWRLFLPQRIVVYDDRLVVKHALYDWWADSWIGNNWWQLGEHVIYWREARLFTIRSSRPGTPTTRYELSSPTQVVTFGRARPSRWWALYRPVIPWEHYEAQMDALLDVIAARTELPLYDVRSGPVQASAQPLASSPLS